MWITLGLNAIFLLWLLCNHAGPSTRKVVSDLSGCAGAFIAAGWCFRGVFARRKAQLSQRILWGANLIGFYLVLYGLGMVFWTYCELALHQDAPFPCLADACYIPSSLCLIAGILLLPEKGVSNASRGRTLLDSLMIMTAMLTFSWRFILGPNIIASAVSTFAKVVTISYPLCDLATLLCLLILMQRLSADTSRVIRWTLPLGIIGTIFADSVYGYMVLQNTYASGSIIDVGWPLSQMLIACGVAHYRQKQLESSGEDTIFTGETAPQRQAILWRSLLPYLFIPAVAFLLVYTLRHDDDPRLEVGVFWGSAVLTGLVMLRQVFAIVENNRLYTFLQEAYAELEALATMDGLTGVKNHRAFQEKLTDVVAEAKRTRNAAALILLDVDRFKLYNDTYGHPAGDQILKQVARILEENARRGDVVARYGGEEFVVILPHTGIMEALQCAERLRAAIETAHWPDCSITASFGVASLTDVSSTEAEIISLADAALYRSKQQGRNCVTCHEENQSAQEPRKAA